MNDEKLAESTATARERFLNLREHWPGALPGIIEFARLLADYMSPKLVPVGFYMAVTLLLYDLGKGKNGFSGKPIDSHLVGHPIIAVAVLPEVGTLARVGFSAAFADAVAQVAADIGSMS